jgi:hypothetical protein
MQETVAVKFVHLCVTFALAAAISAPDSAWSAEGDWRLPSLNPFAGATAQRTASVGDAPTSGWKMPRLWPVKSAAAAAPARPKGPSAWQKMSNGTRTFFSKTADALNPWDDAEENKPIVASGSGAAFRRASAKKDEPSDRFSLPSWSWGSESQQESKPKTVNDFLSQPRPDF